MVTLKAARFCFLRRECGRGAALGFCAFLALPGIGMLRERHALAADASTVTGPSSATVLAKLHQSNQKEVEMGRMAQKNGKSQEVKAFGKTLVKDHLAAEKKVAALARQEKIPLPETTPLNETDMLSSDFDAKFSRAMLEDHKKDIAEATEARDDTNDAKLKALLKGVIPTLKKHQAAAQNLVDRLQNSATNN